MRWMRSRSTDPGGGAGRRSNAWGGVIRLGGGGMIRRRKEEPEARSQKPGAGSQKNSERQSVARAARACLWGRPEFILTLAVLASWRTWRVAFTLLRVCLRALRGFAVIRTAALHRRRWSLRSGFLRSEYRSNVTEYRDHGQDAYATTCAECPCHYAEYRDAWRSDHATDYRHRCLLLAPGFWLPAPLLTTSPSTSQTALPGVV
jgi:hypothetical protein